MRLSAVFAEVLSLPVRSFLTHRRLSASFIAIVFTGLAAPATISGHTGPHVHDMSVNGARVSDSSGQLVITLNARGDLRGLVTLTLSVGPDGTITRGDWALVVPHLEDLNPDGTVATVNEEEPHEHPDEPGEPLEEH